MAEAGRIEEALKRLKDEGDQPRRRPMPPARTDRSHYQHASRESRERLYKEPADRSYLGDPAAIEHRRKLATVRRVHARVSGI